MLQLNLADFISLKIVATIISVSTQVNPTVTPVTPATPSSEPTTIPTPIPTQPHTPSEESNTSQRTPRTYIRRTNRLRNSDNSINLQLQFDSKPIPTPTLSPSPTPTPVPMPIISPTSKPQPPQPPTTPEAPNPTPRTTRTPTPAQTNSDQESSDITQAVNQYRIDSGLEPVQETSEICQVAAIRAKEADSDFSHQGFEAGVEKLVFRKAAENLWQGEPFSLERMVTGWHNSPGHKKNMTGDYNYGCGQRYHNTAAFIFIKT